jgi:hypothetical protein
VTIDPPRVVSAHTTFASLERPTRFRDSVTVAAVVIHERRYSSHHAGPDPVDPSHTTRIHLNICVLPLLLPPASQGLVKLNERQTLVQLGLHQVEFR